MKRPLLLLVTALLGFSAYADVLSPDEALSRALNTNTARRLKGAKATTPRLMKTFTAAAQPAVYLYARGDNSGFLVLSADDATEAVLGYCDNGSLNAENLSPEMTYWLESYADQIAYVREHPSKAAAKAKTIYNEVPVLCKTLWNQDSPYNDQAPTLSSGKKAATGCVATAYAQILKYFNYPETGNGEWEYTQSTNGELSGTSYSFDYTNTTFDWTNMCNEYGSNILTSEAQNAAVATLMYACGVAVNMQWGDQSGSSVSNLQNTYDLFNLDQSITYSERDYYTSENWEKLIYDALAIGPVLYGGQSAAGGHAFVCDGYKDGYFHINWGWGGADNGYYLLSALEAGSHSDITTNAGYNTNQEACIYIQPRKDDSATTYQMSCSNFYINTETTGKLGETFVVNSSLVNTTSGATLNLKEGLKLVNNETNQVYYADGTTIYAMAHFAYVIEYSVTIPSDLPVGEYTVTPCFNVNGTNYDVLVKQSSVQSYTMTVDSEGVCTFSISDDATATLKAENLTLTTPLYANTKFRATVSLTNESDASSYAGAVYLELRNSENEVVATTKTSSTATIPVELAAGETIELTIEEIFKATIDAGEYTLVLLDANGEDLASTNVTVTDGTPTYTLTSPDSSVIIADKLNVDKNNISIKFTVTCTEGTCIDKVIAWIFLSGTVGTNISLTSETLFLNEGDSQEVTFTGSLPSLTDGSEYIVYFHGATASDYILQGPSHATKSSFRVADSSSELLGVDDIDAEAAHTTEYFTLQGVRVAADNLTPGLYIKRDRRADGTIHTTKQLIK